MQGNENKSQAEKFAEALINLKPDISADDRATAMAEFGVSNSTITNYLKGNVMSLDTAVMFIKFFRNRIAQREKILK